MCTPGQFSINTPSSGGRFVSAGKVVFYDYEHCREFLEDHSKQLRETAKGLDILGLYREFYYGFSHEALESSAITLGQFDNGLVYMFVPEMLKRESYPGGHKVARTKALELLQCTEPPMVFELMAAQTMEPLLKDSAHCEKWMRPELLDLLNVGAVEIIMYFNAHGFHDQILAPNLVQQGYSLVDPYLSSAKSGFLRVRHSQAPGKIFKLPWVMWIREMMTGGYSMAYIMACFGNYMVKMNQALPGSDALPEKP